MSPFHNIFVSLALVGFVASLPQALETPFTAYKDGYVSSSSFSGNSRTLLVNANTKAWVSHALLDSATKGLIGARLQIYVKNVASAGLLKVYVGTNLTSYENQTHLSDLKTKDSVGVASLKIDEESQRIVEIPLSAGFLKNLTDRNYTGLVLEGTGGLDAELGALEGSHGAILYLTYASAAVGADSTLVKTLSAELAKTYKEELRGATGFKGATGDTGKQGPIGLTGVAGANGLNGAPGIQGPKGDTGVQGIKGDRGTPGLSGDQTLTFNLLQDRGFRAYWAFNRFSTDFLSTPDSSGQGNPLTLSSLGKNITQQAPGDSVVDFLGNGYASAMNTESLNPYREITLSAKIKLAAIAPPAPDTQTVISKKNQYELAIIDNVLKFRLRTTLGSSGWVGAGAVPKDVWNIVQASYDGKAIRTFVNGTQTFFQSFSNGPIALDSDRVYLGARDATHLLMKGSLDSVKILSYAIPSQDAPTDILSKATRAQLSADSVTGLDIKLGAKSDTAHTHPIAKVVNLQSTLDAKANLAGAGFSGKVGFGTSMPTAPIHVDVIGSRFDQDTTLARFTHEIPGTTGGRTVDFLIDYRGLGYGDGTLALREDRAGKDFMTVNMLPTGVGPRINFPTGKVGIGTSAPLGVLDVEGGTAPTGAGLPIVLNAQKGGAASAGGNIVLNSGENGVGGAVGNILFSTGGVPGAGGTTTNERMRIDGNGDIGMGSLYSGVALTVSRLGSVPAVVRIQGNSTQNNPLTALELRHVNTPSAGNLGQAVDIDLTVELASTSSQAVAAKIRAGKEEDFTVVANADSYLAFSTMKDGTATEKLRINSQGDVVTGPNILMNGTSASGMMCSNRVTISAAGPQDFIRFLKNGIVYGTNAVVGYVYIYARNIDSGVNAESYIYILTTTGNGITDASCQLVKSQVRGVSPVSAISLVNDGSGGGIKLVVTKTTATPTLEVFSTFVGTTF